MSLLEAFIYGLLSGFSEILPVSSAAHQELMKRVFGLDTPPNTVNFLVRLSVLAVLIYSSLPELKQLRGIPVGGRRPRPSADLRLVRTAAVPLLLGFLLVRYVRFLGERLPLLSLLLILNGLILYIPSRMLHGNKDARGMSGWDGLLLGFFGTAGTVPGISRTGVLLSVASARGADRRQGLKWMLILSVPALAVLCLMDLAALITLGSGAAVGFPGIVSAVSGAAVGCYFGIKLLRYLAVKAGFSGFAFYCWGVALFSFVMYLTVV